MKSISTNPCSAPTSSESLTDQEFAKPGDKVRIFGRQWKLKSGYIAWCGGCDFGIREQVMCTNLTHGLCQLCYQRLEERKCSWCRAEERTVDATTKETLNRALVHCADACTFQCTEEGCTWKSQYSDLAQHANNCTAHIYPCLFQEHGCKERDTKDKLHLHVINCPYRERDCQQCQQPYSIAFAEKHAQSCPQRLETSAISLPHASWKLLEPMGQWSDLDPEAQQKALQTTITLMTEAQKISLASAIANKTAISTLCKFDCGAILQHPNQLTEHYQSHCPNGLTSCRHCKFECLRKELGQHYEHCLEAPVPCPWGCDETVTRHHSKKGGYHEAHCDNVLIKCTFCEQPGTRAVIKLHTRTCDLRPWSCQYCGHLTHTSQQEAHGKICSETQPFTLAGCQYTLQPEISARIYQRTNESVTSHVCIPTTKASLQAWIRGNAGGLEYELRVQRQSKFTFQLGQDWLNCYFSDTGKLCSIYKTFTTLHLYYVDANGHDLGKACSGNDRHYLLGEGDTRRQVDYFQEARILYELPENAPVFVIISLLPHAALFSKPLP